VSVAGKVRQGRGAVTAQLGAPLLLCALSVALLAQGAYYLRAQLYVAALIGAALVVSPGLTRLASSDRAIAFRVGGLAGWAVIDAAMHHNPRAALPYGLFELSRAVSGFWLSRRAWRAGSVTS
jgi:hypothetical protein